jgi:hypothetical protein
MTARVTSGRLCEDALLAFDRLCALEAGDAVELTPRQKHRRGLLEQRGRAAEWLVPPELAETVDALITTANRIEDPVLARLWTDHLPIAVLACLERRSLARRIADGDALVALIGV